MAKVLGRISAKIRISRVITPAEATRFQGAGNRVSMACAAISETKILIRLLPNNTEPIIVSWSEISWLTRLAARSPSRSSWCMRPRLAPVSAVSAAENTAEIASEPEQRPAPAPAAIAGTFMG